MGMERQATYDLEDGSADALEASNLSSHRRCHQCPQRRWVFGSFPQLQYCGPCRLWDKAPSVSSSHPTKVGQGTGLRVGGGEWPTPGHGWALLLRTGESGQGQLERNWVEREGPRSPGFRNAKMRSSWRGLKKPRSNVTTPARQVLFIPLSADESGRVACAGLQGCCLSGCLFQDAGAPARAQLDLEAPKEDPTSGRLREIGRAGPGGNHTSCWTDASWERSSSPTGWWDVS